MPALTTYPKVPTVNGIHIKPQAIAFAALTTVFTGDVYIDCLVLTNTTAGGLSVTIQDAQGSPIAILGSSTVIDPNYTYIVPIQREIWCPGGLSWQASATGLVGYVSGRQ